MSHLKVACTCRDEWCSGENDFIEISLLLGMWSRCMELLFMFH